MATEPQRDGDRQSDLAVMDANEYKQKRRLERILDSLDGVQDIADEAWADYVTGEIERDALNITIQRAVKSAIRECSVLLKDHHRDTDGKGRYWAGNPSNSIGTIETPGEGDDIVIVGLADYLESKQFYSAEVRVPVAQRNKPSRTVTKSVEYTLPSRVSYNAYLRLKEFLDDVHDMEITFEEMDKDKLPMIRHFDQSDENGESDDADSENVQFNGSPDL